MPKQRKLYPIEEDNILYLPARVNNNFVFRKYEKPIYIQEDALEHIVDVDPYEYIDQCYEQEPNVSDERTKQVFSEVLTTLTPKEEKVIRMRYYENKPLTEIAAVFSVQQERIRQIEAKALRKLKHPTRSKKLLSA